MFQTYSWPTSYQAFVSISSWENNIPKNQLQAQLQVVTTKVALRLVVFF
jgi:hypothetical protein